MSFKVNTIGEENFPEKMTELLENSRYITTRRMRQTKIQKRYKKCRNQEKDCNFALYVLQ